MNYDKRKQQLLASGLALLIVASLVTSVSLVATQPARAQTPINSCTTITQPGEYELTQDITDSPDTTCIDIQADDVVLDGNGHTIDGVDAVNTVGVQSQSQTNVTVENLTVTDWLTGISVDSSDNHTLTNITANNNNLGIFFTNRTNNI
ncbi:hypothetical protein [Haladaptatus sp. DFWS20]|uniref:hypothetical protein n=1 Tax=Haladaptatus sp. DFWS20 TaxID=3403467 RepID=UPI003EBE6C8E